MSKNDKKERKLLSLTEPAISCFLMTQKGSLSGKTTDRPWKPKAVIFPQVEMQALSTQVTAYLLSATIWHFLTGFFRECDRT